MGHVGKFILAYIQRRCPQAQPRIYPAPDGWVASVVGNGEDYSKPPLLGKVMQGGMIHEMCHNLLTMAGYQKKTGDNGEIYYG